MTCKETVRTTIFKEAILFDLMTIAIEWIICTQLISNWHGTWSDFMARQIPWLTLCLRDASILYGKFLWFLGSTVCKKWPRSLVQTNNQWNRYVSTVEANISDRLRDMWEMCLRYHNFSCILITNLIVARCNFSGGKWSHAIIKIYVQST